MNDSNQQFGTNNGPREYKIGPMVFVPGFRVDDNDRWAHRKGEPRLFALLWSIYLMACALVTVFATRSLGVPMASRFRYGAESLIVMVCLGATLLWTLTRLSQRPPRSPVRATLADLLVVLAPVQAVIWPMPMITGWPLEVAAAIATLATCWVIACSGIIVLGADCRSGVERTAWMFGVITLLAAGPLLHIALVSSGGAPDAHRVLLVASPISGVSALSSAPGNLQPTISRTDWIVVAAPAALGLLAWLLRPLVSTSDGPNMTGPDNPGGLH